MQQCGGGQNASHMPASGAGSISNQRKHFHPRPLSVLCAGWGRGMQHCDHALLAPRLPHTMPALAQLRAMSNACMHGKTAGAELAQECCWPKRPPAVGRPANPKQPLQADTREQGPRERHGSLKWGICLSQVSWCLSASLSAQPTPLTGWWGLTSQQVSPGLAGIRHVFHGVSSFRICRLHT
jgi:hypothetical protein